METKPTTYTEEFVEKEVKLLHTNLLADEGIVFLGELIELRPYTMQRFGEWNNAFKDKPEISATIGKIKDVLQTRAFVGGLKNKLSPVLTKFHLINNFDWKDKSETDITTGGEKLEGGAASTEVLAVTKAFELELRKALAK